MKIRSTFILCCIILSFSIPTSIMAEPEVLAQAAPVWNVGDTWRFRVGKDLDRTVTQGAGMLQISMRLDRVENTMTYVVTGTGEAEGGPCYVLSVSGNQKLTGDYSVGQIQGETSAGTLVQQSTIQGKEYRRTEDLAFVRAELRSTGTIQLAGALGGFPVPFESHSVTTTDKPAQLLKFPLVEGDKWLVSSSLNTASSGTSSDSIITTFNYECSVLGKKTITLENGETHSCIAISQNGTQTTQSQNSGINIDNISGTLYYSPAAGNRVRDEAEGEELLGHIKGEEGSGENT